MAAVLQLNVIYAYVREDGSKRERERESISTTAHDLVTCMCACVNWEVRSHRSKDTSEISMTGGNLL